ncbi:MAG TPA: TetR family transcriptional regulator [Ideonella sp.]|nr:TetR family transcriptional regulator [Ideonella sp.]
MARKTAEDSQRTRDAILDAAERVLCDKGVSAATVNDIADAAGVSRGAVYGHYRNKIEVALAMCERTLGRIAYPVPQPQESALGLLLQGCLDFLKLARGSSSMQRVLEVLYQRCEPSAENEPLMRVRQDLERAGSQNVLTLIGAAVAAGELPDSLDRQLACDFLQSLVGGIYSALTCTERLDAAGMRGVQAMLAAGLDTLRHSQCLREGYPTAPQ